LASLGAKGGGELAMFLRDVMQVSVGAQADPGQQEQMHLRADRMPRVFQPTMVGGGIYRIVECDVAADHFMLILGPLHTIGRLLDVGDVVVRGVGNQLFDGELFECATQTVDLGDILRRQRGDRGAAMPRAAHQALALQPEQGFADRATTDVERLGQFHLAQLCTGCVGTVEDRVPDAVRDLVGKAPAAGGGDHALARHLAPSM